MAEYECFPIWRDDPAGVTNIAPDDLGLPDALVSKFNSWAMRFEETLDAADPGNSGFADAATEEAFYSEGLELAQELVETLGGDVEVCYFDARTGESRLI